MKGINLLNSYNYDIELVKSRVEVKRKKQSEWELSKHLDNYSLYRKLRKFGLIAETKAGNLERELDGLDDGIKYLVKYLRLASVYDYEKWIRGYMLKGGIVHCDYYNQSFPQKGFSFRYFVAIGNFNLPKLCGSTSTSIIIPKGINIKISKRVDGIGDISDEYGCYNYFSPDFNYSYSISEIGHSRLFFEENYNCINVSSATIYRDMFVK